MQIEAVRFCRTQDDEFNGRWQHGIVINNDALIVDMKGKPVAAADIWNYERMGYLLTVHLQDPLTDKA
jgi:hypothetical protein